MRFDAWFHDIRFALRQAGRSRMFYATAVTTLAIGMAGATVMFTLVRGILLRPLPVADEDRLVVSWRMPPSGPMHLPYEAADVEAIGRTSRTLAGVAGTGYNGAFERVWLDGASAFTAQTAVVMGDFFAVAGVPAVLGRGLTADDDRDGAAGAVVLSHAAWQRFFASTPDIVGRRLVTRDRGFIVVGVMPADFAYPRGVELWTSRWGLAAGEGNPAFRDGLLRGVELVGRLRRGVTLAQAEDELTTLTAALDARAPAGTVVPARPTVRSFKAAVVGDIDPALALLFAAVGLVLLIAAANVANLLLMRGEARRREFVVRAALGAGRGRIARLQLAESLVVTVGAATLGLLLTRWSLQGLAAFVPGGIPRPDAVRLDLAVIGFTTAVALAVAALCALVPAWAAASIDVASALRAGGRGVRGTPADRGRRLLAAAQVALAVAVVAAAGLLIRSLWRLESVDMGLAHDRIVLAALDVPADPYGDGDRRQQFLDAMVERLGAMPGIDGVTPLNTRPFAGSGGWDVPRFTAEGQSAAEVAVNPPLNLEAVHPSYFATLDIALTHGRAFASTDRPAAPRVAVVSQDVADRLWPAQDPIGRRLKMGGVDSTAPWLTVVGVAAPTRYRELTTPRPTLYVPAEQFMVTASTLAIRAAAPAGQVAAAVRDTLQAVAPDVRVLRVAPYADHLQRPLAQPRFNAMLLGVFAISAWLLSAIGLYGVMAAAVRQRQGEIGVRLALGASVASIRGLVLGESLRLAALGAGAGLALAVAATRMLRGLLFEIEPLDPATLAGAALVLVAAALLATWLPARRATRVDPAEVLRAE